MTRLIDADALKDTLGISDRDIEFAEMLDEQPTVDAEPVRHGHWIWHKEYKNIYGAKRVECSYCHTHLLVANIADEHYCRNCGAKMDAQEKYDDRKID